MMPRIMIQTVETLVDAAGSELGPKQVCFSGTGYGKPFDRKIGGWAGLSFGECQSDRLFMVLALLESLS